MSKSRRKRSQRKPAERNRTKAHMHLSAEDVRQLDEAYLLGLEEGRLRTLSLKLVADLKALHERLGQTPDNSSRPPSSREPWAAVAGRDEEVAADAEAPGGDEAPTATAAAEDEAASRSGGARPGRRPGAPGHGRTQRLAVHEERHHYPERCALCGESFPGEGAERVYSAHYVLDVQLGSAECPGLQVIQRKDLYHACGCACGHWTVARPAHQPGEGEWTVALSERHLVGPLLVALICALSLRLRLSRRRIQEFLADWLQLSLSTALINQCLHEAGRAVEPVVEEQLLAEVRASALLHADETSWKEHGHLLWLWVFSCATTSVFRIGRRTQELLHGVLGEAFAGWLMSDGYWAYRDYDNRLRCLSHLQRKARGLEESLERSAQAFGRRLREHIEAVMAAVYAAREGPPPRSLREQHAAALNGLLDLCLAQAESAHAKTRALARELLNDWDTFWVVLDHPELPLTNNVAERALRHWVIARRISYGTRTAQGSRVVAALASVIETCRQRGHSPWAYIAEVLRVRRQGHPAPVLPAPIGA
jgi:transposase